MPRHRMAAASRGDALAASSGPAAGLVELTVDLLELQEDAFAPRRPECGISGTPTARFQFRKLVEQDVAPGAPARRPPSRPGPAAWRGDARNATQPPTRKSAAAIPRAA